LICQMVDACSAWIVPFVVCCDSCMCQL
jgi:hypothetical protein